MGGGGRSVYVILSKTSSLEVGSVVLSVLTVITERVLPNCGVLKTTLVLDDSTSLLTTGFALLLVYVAVSLVTVLPQYTYILEILGKLPGSTKVTEVSVALIMEKFCSYATLNWRTLMLLPTPKILLLLVKYSVTKLVAADVWVRMSRSCIYQGTTFIDGSIIPVTDAVLVVSVVGNALLLDKLKLLLVAPQIIRTAPPAPVPPKAPVHSTIAPPPPPPYAPPAPP